MSESPYVLITAARNEESYIERTIKSVIAQTILPQKWVIVSDGSTDHTDEIARAYATKYNFIQFMRINSKANRNFASKVHAFSMGYEQVRNIKYDFIGNLDADISFETDYYQRVIAKFQENPNLGIAGGKIIEFYNRKYFNVVSSTWHVGGAVQLFRRKCFEEIGGYIPNEKGGVDAIVEFLARMHGWEVKKYSDIRVVHNKPLWIKRGHILLSKFRWGVKDYSLGYHPFYEFVKACNRTREKPYLLSSLFRISGYCFSLLRREPQVLPAEVIKYVRQEQMQRLRAIIFCLKRNIHK